MDEELKILLQALRAAGAVILRLQQEGFTFATKANNDMVTLADLQANDIIKRYLLTAFPTDGWLSEESVDDAVRLACKRVWIVDPIDGTKEFAAGIPEYAISVALIQQHEPVLSAVYNPATNELYYARKNQGAWLADETHGDRQIHCATTLSEKLVLLASRSEYQRGAWDVYAKQHDVRIIGSIAYKLALVAAGKAQATFSLGPKNEWDIAGGVLLVTEAGGIVTDQAGTPIRFNQQAVLVSGIVASSADAYQRVRNLIAPPSS